MRTYDSALRFFWHAGPRAHFSWDFELNLKGCPLRRRAVARFTLHESDWET